MKCDKKFLGKKKKKDDNDEQEERTTKQKDNENNKNIVKNENNSNKEEVNSNNFSIERNNINNDSVKNDTLNNSILISKKNTYNNSNTTTLFTSNKTTTVNKDTKTNENEVHNKNEVSSQIINDNNPINNNENNQQQKNNPINSTITSKYKNTNSAYSVNSEDSHSNSPPAPRGSQSKNANPKFKSHLQNSRNTAFGLKEISKRVMDIIKQSGQTTYKAISDQIVNEINQKDSKDEKNIRRRIYDSLNVMKSMKLFHRDKSSKTIMWNYDQEFDPLNEIENKNEGDEKNNEYKIDSWNIVELKKEIKEKKEKVNLLTKDLCGLKNVLERNKREDENIPENNKLFFPFIVIEFSSDKTPKINVALNENQTKAHFGFDEAEAMYGDLDAVSKIGNHPNFAK